MNNIKKVIASLITITFINAPAVCETIGCNDYVIVSDSVNYRLSPSIEGYKLGSTDNETTTQRILETDQFDLVLIDNNWVFVNHDYVKTIGNADGNINLIENNDIVKTTVDNLNIRLYPLEDSKSIAKLYKGTECIVYAENDDWYLVETDGKIGFIKKEYTISLKEIVRDSYPELLDIEVYKICYTKEDTILDINGEVKIIDKNTVVKVLKEENDNYLCYTDSGVGYINKNSLEKLDGTFVVVDISSQSIVLYYNNDMILNSACTTGKDSTPTTLGKYGIRYKETNHDFKDYGVSSNYWMPFNGGEGFHDATWQSRSFGGSTYKKHGSHGCVRLPLETAERLYNLVTSKKKDSTNYTDVIIQK